jgi:hypothetical protein
MRKITAFLLLALVFSCGVYAGDLPAAVSATASAGNIFFRLSAGYTSMSMDKAAAYMRETYVPLLEPTGATISAQNGTNTALFKADLGYEFGNGLSLGARIEYMLAASTKVSGTIDYMPGISETASFEMRKSAMPLLAGINYGFSPAGGLVLGAGVSAGIAFSMSSLNYVPSVLFVPIVLAGNNATLQGSGFALDTGVSAGFKATPNISLDIEAGYRFCKIPEVKLGRDFGDSSSWVYYKSGDTLKDKDGNAVELDFSGVLVTAGAKVIF